ncbi:MAG: DUF1028 domain-containing protein [Rubrimonas sp.]
MRVNTYSIVARCARTGDLGAAVASAVPAVGAVCLWMRPGVGAVSTQSWANPYLAEATLDVMSEGVAPDKALARALQGDPARADRQIGAVGPSGGGAAFTGADCDGWAGHIEGDGFAAQGNMLTGPEVLHAMAGALAEDRDAPLELRLMRALEAAQAVGGDKRGRQSAAISVVGVEFYPRVDLRVDEHPDPVAELRRVLDVASDQLAPFVDGMPRRGLEPGPAPRRVVQLLSMSPPDRPGGGGSRKP